MGSYIAKRLAALIPILFLISLISFFLIYLSPGDPVDAMLSQGGAVADDEVYYETRSALGLDKPIATQYVEWVGHVLQGNLGNSITTGKPVAVELGNRLPATVFLAFASMALTLLISIPLGMLAAVKKDGPIDYIVRFLSFIGAAMPGFFMGLCLIYLFAIRLHVLPSLGSLSGLGWVLPVLTLALCEAAGYIRQVRTVVIKELGEDYVTAELARGLGRRTILFGSVFKAVLPTILVLAGMSVGQLLGGTAIVETVFGWPGVGSYAVQMISVRDYPVVQGYVLMMALIFVLVNLVVDICHTGIDPRTRSQFERR